MHRTSASVLVLGLVVTAGLSAGAQFSYQHNQQRLTSLQTSLTGSALDATPIEFERRLGPVVEVVANSSDPIRVFRRIIGPSMRPAGPFAAASLIALHDGKPTFLAHLGLAPIRNRTGKVATALYELAAKSGTLVTTRVVGHGIQKFGYMMAASGTRGTFVVSGAQSVPIAEVIKVPKNSPDAGLNVAIYFGRKIDPSSLVASTGGRLPLVGTVSKVVVPFGSSVLTLVASPKTALAGGLSEFLPWLIAGAGTVLVVAIVVLVERLMRRRRQAELLAAQNAQLFAEQRDVAETLQRSFLPSAMPEIPGVEVGAVYLPSRRGAEVGGDWYSVIGGDERFTFVVGDVSGRGIEAASTMATLRYTIRAYANVGLEPEDILDYANKELSFERTGRFATVLIGSVSNQNRELRLASAGHYPPILVADGQSEFIEVPIGPPLGVADALYRSSRISIPSCAMVIAYTDGLFERRGELIDIGLERLRAQSVQVASTVDDRLRTIISALVGSGGDDDIAILGIKWEN
ncbi:MAG TPA: SpoIIE family protein phosphatase [Acidimicrobiales bacterium]|nr:SpoIIE family protein phosphatase [Acidimicrobiales bacterium]